MILINLLPREMRQVEVKERHYSFQGILLGAFFILLVVSFFQLMAYQDVRKGLYHSETKLSSLKEPSSAVEKLIKNVNDELEPHQRFLHQFVMPKILISQTMNELSDLLPDSMWLVQSKIRREQDAIKIDLSGFSRITSKQIALAQIQEYVNAVKGKIEELANASRAEGQIAPPRQVKAVLTTSRREIEKNEVMQFDVSFLMTNVPTVSIQRK